MEYRNRARYGRVAKALSKYSLYFAFSNLIDYVLYSYLYIRYGLIAVPVMISFTALLDIATLLFYFKRGTDFIGVETAKQELSDIMSAEPRGWFGRLRLRVASAHTNVPKIAKIAVLSLEFNPFMVAAMLRAEPLSNRKITTTDWRVFTTSFFIGNAYWAIILTGIWSGVLAAIRHLF